jgi:hypothetical protein
LRGEPPGPGAGDVSPEGAIDQRGGAARCQLAQAIAQRLREAPGQRHRGLTRIGGGRRRSRQDDRRWRRGCLFAGRGQLQRRLDLRRRAQAHAARDLAAALPELDADRRHGRRVLDEQPEPVLATRAVLEAAGEQPRDADGGAPRGLGDLALAPPLALQARERVRVDALLGEAIHPALQRLAQRVVLGQLPELAEQRRARDGPELGEHIVVVVLAPGLRAQPLAPARPLARRPRQRAVDLDRRVRKTHGSHLPRPAPHHKLQRAAVAR